MILPLKVTTRFTPIILVLYLKSFNYVCLTDKLLKHPTLKLASQSDAWLVFVLTKPYYIFSALMGNDIAAKSYY